MIKKKLTNASRLFSILAISLISAQTQAAMVTIDFTFGAGGTGRVSFDNADATVPDTSIPFSDISNFTANFQIGSESWDEGDLFGKYSSVLNDPNVLLSDFSGIGTDWRWDDIGYDGGDDSAILGFDNGTTSLSFDELTRVYRIDGTFEGVFTAQTSVVPIPAAVWLFGTALIGLVGFSKRRKAA